MTLNLTISELHVHIEHAVITMPADHTAAAAAINRASDTINQETTGIRSAVETAKEGE